MMNLILFLLGISFGMMLPKSLSFYKIIQGIKHKCVK